MTAPNPQMDQPRIVDEDAHRERVSLDQQIRTLTDKLTIGERPNSLIEHHKGLLKLQDLQEKRRDAFRREVGWEE
ncbi:hypothetical protein [Nocardia sp. NPDC051570]|uniref:hypothetical protein n=1 Tax=Nocardia sp. NPDC051570 TaxID=3364324 RepID=UPI0037AFAB56